MQILDWWWQDIPVISSTNDEALRLSSNPPSPKYIITAETQTLGRGRRGRVWDSLNGNLFASFALKNSDNLLNFLPFIMSLSLFDVITKYIPSTDIILKWPNDVLVRGNKISGILLEKGDNNYIIAGIGVNLIASPHELPSALYSATSLVDCGVKVEREKFLREYTAYLDNYLCEFYAKGSELIIKKWLSCAHQIGQSISVNLEHNVKTGIFAGLDKDGALLLENNGVTTKIYAGDVFINDKKD